MCFRDVITHCCSFYYYFFFTTHIIKGNSLSCPSRIKILNKIIKLVLRSNNLFKNQILKIQGLNDPFRSDPQKFSD